VNCRDRSSPTITNCIISGNSAIGSGGGGVYCNDSSPTIINCIISGNDATSGSGGGGVQCISNSSPTLINCILWNNTPDEIYLGSDASATVTYSDVQGGWPGEGNIDAAPLLVDPAGDDNIIGTEDDDLRLLGNSPCFDTGNNAAVPTSVVTDYDGNPRIINGKVDMGAYESPTANFILSTSSLVIPEGQTATFTVALTESPLEIVDVTVAHHVGDRDIKVESGGLLTFSAQNYMDPQTVTLVAAEDSDNLDGTARIRIGAHGYPVVKLVVREWDNESLYVDADATGANNGSSWDDAFVNLQDALSLARANLENLRIHVAQGVYTPDRGADLTLGDRSATFQLIDGVTLKGGFAGFGEPDPNSREIDLYETILSGDLLGNDIESPIAQIDTFGGWRDEPPFVENSFHVVTSRHDNPTAVLDGLTITGGNANGSYENYGAGGLSNGGLFRGKGSSITVLNCTFTRNSASGGGGGMNSWSNPTLVNCKFIDNYAAVGGGMSHSRSNPTLINCTFSDNFAIFHGSGSPRGGGMASSGNPTLTNCAFFRNRALRYGGAIDSSGSPTLVNCTFTENTVEESWSSNRYIGGAIYSRDGMVTLTNCILWGDQPDEIALDWQTASPMITYTNIQGGWPDRPDRRGIIDADPLFVDADGPDNIPGTEDDDLRLSPLSLCIDAGDPDYVPEPNETDLAGKPRLRYGRIDMGAYESQADFVLSTTWITVPEAETATFTVMPARDPLGTIEVTVAHRSGDTDITVESGALLTFDSSNYTQPQTVTLAAAEEGDYLKGMALIQVSAPGLAHAEVIASEWDNDAPPLYVDADAAGANNGSSWADAFVNLQDALSLVKMSPHIEQIRVAQGIYKPDRGADQTPGDRNALFQLIDGVALMGGYAGFAEPDPNARDIKQYETILSGDLNGDDIDIKSLANLEGALTFMWAENTYQVVEAKYVDAATVLDGFTITSSSSVLTDIGSGMSNKDASPTINNCTFRGNYATAKEGGGMYNDRSNPTLTNCTFSANAAYEGGGMANRRSNPTLINCTFSGNHATDNEGGGMANCLGGGMANCLSNSTLISCSFSGNYATGVGGGMSNIGNSTLINCIFSGNYAKRGSAFDNEGDSNLMLMNCTFSRNVCRVTGGKAILNNSESYLVLTNCIVWDNTGDRIQGHATVSYSNIQAGWPGRGNINADPLFADPLGPDNIAGTEDDDLRLQSQVGRWDPNSQAWVQDVVTSPCIDAGDPTSLIGLEPSPNGGIINMGAYGGTSEASKSP